MISNQSCRELGSKHRIGWKSRSANSAMSTLLSKRGQQRWAEISYCSWRNLPAHTAKAGASGEGSSCYLFPSDRNAHKKSEKAKFHSSQLALLPPPTKRQKLVWWTPPIILERLSLRAKRRVLSRPCCLNADPITVRENKPSCFPVLESRTPDAGGEWANRALALIEWCSPRT